MASPVVHFEILGADGKRCRDFYGKLFGWNFQLWEGAGDYGMVSAATEKNSIGGGVGQTMAGMGPMLTFYVMVDDLQASLDKAAKMGATTLQPPTPIPGIGASALFRDPDGLIVGLFKPEPGMEG